MKVIEQLINYFQSCGVLTGTEIERLHAEGFLPERKPDTPDLCDEEPEPLDVELFGHEENEPWDDIDSTEPSSKRRRRTGASLRSHGSHRQCTAQGLSARLREWFPAWGKELEGLRAIASAVSPCRDWKDAAVVIRKADIVTLAGAVSAGLAKRRPSLDSLWTALSVEPFRETGGLCGPAISAYAAVLGCEPLCAQPELRHANYIDPATDHQRLGKHAWILREDAVAAVFNVLQAQRHVLAACGSLLRQDPRTLGDALHRDPHPLAFWTLVILHNSVRLAAQGTESRIKEYGPLCDAPPHKAWAQAVMMDRARAMRVIDRWVGLAAAAKRKLRSLRRMRENLIRGTMAGKGEPFNAADSEIRALEALASRARLSQADQKKLNAAKERRSNLILCLRPRWRNALESYDDRIRSLESEENRPDRLLGLVCPVGWKAHKPERR